MTMQTENVWDYPRPAICEPFSGNLRIVHGGRVLAETSRGFRTLETSHPPTYYFPPDAVDLSQLHNSEHRTFCEWKGAASYFDLEGASGPVANVGWAYRRPSQLFEPITDYLSFYASRVDACFVEGEQVQAQAGDFYGGWITSNLVGPFKGVAGSHGW